jgi:hypothetical protein
MFSREVTGATGRAYKHLIASRSFEDHDAFTLRF